MHPQTHVGAHVQLLVPLRHREALQVRWLLDYGRVGSLVGPQLALGAIQGADELRVETDLRGKEMPCSIGCLLVWPGGSPRASDRIGAGIERAKKGGRPVVVSMWAYAASGRYYVSTGADAILAMPSTITGSIGVFNGKFVIYDALNRYTGANIASIQAGGDFANAYSTATPYTHSQKAAQTAPVTFLY